MNFKNWLRHPTSIASHIKYMLRSSSCGFLALFKVDLHIRIFIYLGNILGLNFKLKNILILFL